MGSHSRRKGTRGENELANKIGATKISRTGYTGPDLLWRDRHVEVKREHTPISKRIVTLLDNAQIVADRGDNGEWIAHLRWDELLDIINEAETQTHLAADRTAAKLTDCRIREANLMIQLANLQDALGELLDTPTP